MSLQRTRGEWAKIYRTVVRTDLRGYDRLTITTEHPHKVRVWEIPNRSSRAEVPGQQQINTIRIGVPLGLDGLTLWSQVEWRGKVWDIAEPPSHRYGSRHSAHTSLVLRERPNRDIEDGV